MVKKPVRVVAHFSRVYDKRGRFLKETGLRYTVHARLLGTTVVSTIAGTKELPYMECGHNHRTAAGANRCLRILTENYNTVRSHIAKQAAAKRKAKREFCDFHPDVKLVNGHCPALDNYIRPSIQRQPIGNTD